MSKKGIEMTVTRAIIIAVLVIVILMLWVGDLGDFLGRHSEDSICKQSVRTHVFTKIRNNVLFSDFKCPTRHFTIKEDVTEENMDKIKDIIAREMYTCCDNFGQCYTEDHPPWDLFDTSLGETKYCILCSVFDFKDKGKEVDHFIQYLAETPVPSPTFKEPISYFTAFSNVIPTPQMIEQARQTTSDTIYTDNYYAIMLTYSKSGTLNKIWAYFTAGGALAGIGSVVAGIILLPVPVPGARVASAILISSAFVGGAAGGYVGATKFGGISSDAERSIFLMPYTEENIANLDCEMLPMSQDANT